MITLGVDLASAAEKTAAAAIEWTSGRAILRRLLLGCDDALLLAIPADVIGIDAPFGWPVAFQALLAELHTAPAWTTEWRDRLRFRETDRVVRAATGRWPLSVSTDLIGVPALRCRGLLERLGVQDRSGDGRVFEVYPAAALKRWGLPASGYKKKATDARRAVVDALKIRAPWLEWGAFEALAVASHDALDAVIAALATRAAALGRYAAPDAAMAQAARIEGWIVLPDADALDRLLDG